MHSFAHPKSAVRRALAAAVLLSIGINHSGAAENAGSLEERLQALEAQVSKLADENAELRRQVATPTAADRHIAPLGKETKLSIGGYLHLQGEAGGAPDSRFPREDRYYLRRARLQVKGEFGSDYDFVLQTDFGNNSISGKTGASGQLADLYVRWKKYPEAVVTMGQFKTPFGYDQLLSDTKIATVERSLPSDKLTVSRQIGIGLSGTLFDGVVNYATGMFNGNKANNGANDNDSFMYVGRLGCTVFSRDDRSLDIAANAYTSDDTGSFTGTHTGWGIDAQARWARLSGCAEYLTLASDPVSGAKVDAEGWSLMGVWEIQPKHWEGVVRYESYDPRTDLRNDDTRLWTVGANYLIRGNDIKLSVNYLFGETAGQSDDRVLARLQLVY